MQDLSGKVALVTIGTRGMGRGIAYVLGQQGATVYFTERREASEDLPDTLPIPDETGGLITAPYPTGIGVSVNHADASEVKTLVARIEREQGRLDILVNSYTWHELYDYQESPRVFWAPPKSWLTETHRWDRMFEWCARADFLMTQAVTPLMIAQKSGLIINATYSNDGKYLGDLYTDLAKATSIRMAQGVAHELRPYGIAAIALSHGLVRVEYIMAKMHRQERLKNDPVGQADPARRYDPNFDPAKTESVQYIGQAVAALAADPNILEKSGQLLAVADLAKEYGFTDIDGRWIPPYKEP